MSADLDELVRLLRGRTFAALTGAGCSTASGIPDYRGEGTAKRARQPIQHREFVASSEFRRRYWARAMVGWERFSGARPNDAHRALADLEASGVAVGVVTQNVDSLHEHAGSRRLVKLHGTLATVRCLDCRAIEPRERLQLRLREANPDFVRRPAAFAPDGDAEVDDAALAAFRTVDCTACGGVLKPDVVFFGGSVARDVVDDAFTLTRAADVLLVAGSSLAVFSGFRFVRDAHQRGQPIVVINRGPTRADGLETVRIDADVGATLRALRAAITPLRT